MEGDVCENCGRVIKIMIFRGTGHCGENCRKIAANEMLCTYEWVDTDEVGKIQVCYIHGDNSRHPEADGPHRPCLTLDPYPANEEGGEG